MTFHEWLTNWVKENQRFFAYLPDNDDKWLIFDSTTKQRAHGSATFAMETAARFEASHMNNEDVGRAAQIADAFAAAFPSLADVRLESLHLVPEKAEIPK